MHSPNEIWVKIYIYYFSEEESSLSTNLDPYGALNITTSNQILSSGKVNYVISDKAKSNTKEAVVMNSSPTTNNAPPMSPLKVCVYCLIWFFFQMAFCMLTFLWWCFLGIFNNKYEYIIYSNFKWKIRYLSVLNIWISLFWIWQDILWSISIKFSYNEDIIFFIEGRTWRSVFCYFSFLV